LVRELYDVGRKVANTTQTAFPGIKVIKAGILEGDELDNAKWEAELFAPRRQKWVSEVDGAAQLPAMPE
jgi:hypothetical protein